VRAPAIVSVVSTARAGSTVLGVFLAEQPGWFVAGELELLHERAAERRRLCGCGELVAECPVWSAVLERVGDDDDVERVAAAIAAVTGARVIVDTSKSIERVEAVRRSSLRGATVHLLRDPRAVAYSSMRRPFDKAAPPFSVRAALKIAFHWVKHNARIERLEPDHRVRYEDFVATPDATRTTIATLVGAPPSAATGATTENHAVSGNPGRRSPGPLVVALDDAWKRELPRRHRAAITFAIAPVIVRYGYRLRP
jgi:hypothetical protein